MMGVTFAAVAPMVAMANSNPGVEGAGLIFGAIIGAGIISTLLAPVVSRLLRYFPPVVTGTIIAVIGISLMRVGINWIFGVPVGPTAPLLVDPTHAQWLAEMKALAGTTVAGTGGTPAVVPDIPKGLALASSTPNPRYAQLPHMAIAGLSLVAIMLVAKFGRGFIANISVLLGIVIAGIAATGMGMMTFEKVGKAPWFDFVLPFEVATPVFDPILILTMSLVMIVVMIESTGMFLALSDITGKRIDQKQLAAGLRVDGVGTLIGGIFNTFPYTSFSQNVGLVGVTGVKSRYVCVTAGLILVLLGMLPKLAALVESLPTFVLGGAGLVMFGMVAATGIRILAAVDYKNNRNNLFIVAVSIGMGMIPLIAPRYMQWLPHGIHPLIESGILLASVTAVLLNLFFNGGEGDTAASVEAAKAAEAH
jgi:uric acid transporter